MADWFEDPLNLDLNLGPGSDPSLEESVDIVGSLNPALQMHLSQTLRQRTRQRLRWRSSQPPLEEDRSLELVVDSDENGGGTSQVGEGSVVPEERSCEVLKTCEHNVTSLESGLVQEKENAEKSITESGSFFDCNICLDLAREPIVTCCGHLFCWSCIYCWLHIHSDAKECPVCKGEVTLKNVTPIYGRGNHTHEIEEDLGVKIPARPSGRRVESLRQTIQRTSSTFPMDEMIRRLGARFELTRDFLQPPPAVGESEERARARVERILTLRALQGQHASSGGNLEANARARVNRIVGLRELQGQQASPEGDSEANARAQVNSILLRELYGQPVSSEGDSEGNARARVNSRIGLRELQAIQASFLSQENVVDLTRDNPDSRLPPRTYRRVQSHRSSSGAIPTDRFVESYLRRSPPLRRQEMQPSLVDDRDSFSSIAAVAHGESQTVSNTIEIDSRGPEMDSGDSRTLRRRRRLN